MYTGNWVNLFISLFNACFGLDQEQPVNSTRIVVSDNCPIVTIKTVNDLPSTIQGDIRSLLRPNEQRIWDILTAYAKPSTAMNNLILSETESDRFMIFSHIDNGFLTTNQNMHLKLFPLQGMHNPRTGMPIFYKSVIIVNEFDTQLFEMFEWHRVKALQLNIRYQHLIPIEKMISLESMSIWVSEGLTSLRQMYTLLSRKCPKSLSITADQKSLAFTYSSTIAELCALETLSITSFNTLEVLDNYLTSANASSIAKITSLSLQFVTTSAPRHFIGNNALLQNVKVLEIGKYEDSNDDISSLLLHLPNLETLKFTKSVIRQPIKIINAISRLKNLKSLSFVGVVSDLNVSHFCNLHNLKNLEHLQIQSIDSATTTNCHLFRNLKSISLKFFTYNTVQCLREMPRLERLTLDTLFNLTSLRPYLFSTRNLKQLIIEKARFDIVLELSFSLQKTNLQVIRINKMSVESQTQLQSSLTNNDDNERLKIHVTYHVEYYSIEMYVI